MERRFEEKDSETTGSLSTIDAVQRLASYNARASLDNEKQLILFLQSWWSRTYNRPLKDPLLLSYTVEELLYEFYDRLERTKAEEERLEQDGVKIEEEKDKVAEDWAERMEREEQEAELRKQATQTTPLPDPTKDADNVAWMEEQIRIGKKIHGNTFGEDIEEEF